MLFITIKVQAGLQPMSDMSSEDHLLSWMVISLGLDYL